MRVLLLYTPGMNGSAASVVRHFLSTEYPTPLKTVLFVCAKKSRIGSLDEDLERF